MNTNPMLLADFYKTVHPFLYPKGTTKVYSNLTARKSRIPGIDYMVFFGLQYFIKEYMIDYFNTHFFDVPKKMIIDDYKRVIKNAVGDLPSYAHIEALHDLGYLPVKIKALPEGSKVPIRVPSMTIVNTLPEFFWVTNFLETVMSASIWQSCTSATLANEYRILLDKYAKETGMPKEFVDFQGHDFSFRGMSSVESAILSGMAHLLSFSGTDTIPAITALEEYYNADSTKEFIGGSIPATEHSIQCAGGKEHELDTYHRLITEVYPNGLVSIVSDTWDLWNVMTNILPTLKEEIMARDGKVVIRPDSGDPVDIICGNVHWKDVKDWEENKDHADWNDPEGKGVIELLWDVFGGTVNEQGYKVLDPHVGAIYGDSINLQRAKEIAERLKAKGFASQCVLGIGSFTYQYNTRDSLGMAVKATYIEKTINDKTEGYNIFKDPITDDGTKKSLTGLLTVHKLYNKENGGNSDFQYAVKDACTPEEEEKSDMITVFEDGKLVKETSLSEIRAYLKEQNG